MNKRPEVTEATRQAYINEFVKVYMQKDINKITVKELTEITETSRATFYRYFQDVYAIYEYMENHIFEQIKVRMQNCIEKDGSEREFIYLVADMYQEEREYLEVLFKENGLDRFRRRLSSIGKEQIFHNFHLPENNVKVSYIVDYYMSSIIALLTRWVNHPKDMEKDELVELVQELLSTGVKEQLVRYK